METQRVLVIADSEQHDALAAAIPRDAPELLVHTLVLGPSKPREAHAARFPLLIQCIALAKLLLILPRDLVVKCRDVRWDPRAFLDYSVFTGNTTAIYFIVPFGILPNERAVGEQRPPSMLNERHRLLALPTNSLLEIDPTRGRGEAEKRSDIRLVEVVPLALSGDSDSGAEDTTTPVQANAYQELILDIRCDPSNIARVRKRLSEIGAHVKDLSVRLNDPLTLRELSPLDVNTVVGIGLCTSLLSITLSQTFITGQGCAALRSWRIYTGMLHSMRSAALRRVQLCVTIQQDEGGDTMVQVKQTRWKDFVAALRVFPKLEEVVLTIRGDDEWLCDEVWRVIELPLRDLRGLGKGVRLLRGQFCVV